MHDGVRIRISTRRWPVWLPVIPLFVLILLLAACSRPTIEGFFVHPSAQSEENSPISIGLVVQNPTADITSRWESRNHGSLEPNGILSVKYTGKASGYDVVTAILLSGGREVSRAPIVINVMPRSITAPGIRTAEAPRPPAAIGSVPAITVTTIPEFRLGNDHDLLYIEGVVTNTNPGLHRIVIYSLGSRGGTFFVQPSTDRRYTEINEDGSWEERIHPGVEYWILLVRSDYTKAPATLTSPPTKDANILEIQRIRPQRPVASPE